MKKVFFILLLIPLISIASCQDKKVDKDRLLLNSAYNLLKREHFVKRKTDRKFFQQVFDIYLDSIDPYKLFFLEQEKKELFEQNFPEENLDPILRLLEKTWNIHAKRGNDYFVFSQKMLSKPVNLETSQVYNTHRQEIPFATSEKELAKRWGENSRYNLIKSVVFHVYPNAKSLSEKGKKIDLKKIQEEKQKELLDFLKKSNNTIRLSDKRTFLTKYLKAMARAYDRHSNFFSPPEKENFDSHMKGSFEGIGAFLNKRSDGLLEVVSLIAGGPSYRQKELEAGDIIIKIGQKPNPEGFVEVKKKNMNECISLIRGEKGTTVHLHIKKKDGTIKTISIVREKVVLEEVFAKSAILKKNNKKVGYLFLPTFYSNFSQKKNPRSAATDILKELEYFNREKVEGLIFDLRNNSGGYLQEAIKIAGFFFKTGPVVIVRSANNNKIPLVDIDKNVIFDKPVVVFINQNSASASEIVAGALQDYKRAVVIGSEQSYGKGTVQTISTLNNHNNTGGGNQNKTLGSLKYTIQKFYRVTGISTQILGVRPDIILPFPNRTKQMDDNLYGTIKNDRIDAVHYKKWGKDFYNVAKLQKKSQQRLAKNRYFQTIKKLDDIVETHYAQKVVDLSLSKTLDKRKKFLSQLDRHSVKESEKPLNFEVMGKPFNKTKKEESGFKEKSVIYQEWLKDLRKDSYLEEGLEVMLNILTG